MPGVGLALFAAYSVQTVTRVELNTGFCRVDLKQAASGWLVNPRGQSELVIIAALVQHPVVIEAEAESELFVILINVATNRFGNRKIERRSCNGRQFPFRVWVGI